MTALPLRMCRHAAEFAANAANPKRLAEYDEIRRATFKKLQAAMEAEAYSERTTDGLIAMLRLEVCLHGRGQMLGAWQAAGKWSSRLADDGRLRLLVEQWSLQSRLPVYAAVERCKEHELPSLECRACRDTVAAALDVRGDELEIYGGSASLRPARRRRRASATAGKPCAIGGIPAPVG